MQLCKCDKNEAALKNTPLKARPSMYWNSFVHLQACKKSMFTAHVDIFPLLAVVCLTQLRILIHIPKYQPNWFALLPVFV